jgi:hypothetical protein
MPVAFHEGACRKKNLTVSGVPFYYRYAGLVPETGQGYFILPEADRWAGGLKTVSHISLARCLWNKGSGLPECV